MNIDLSGKVAIVTGAGRGIGLGIARVFQSEGIKTVVTDIRQDLLHEWTRELETKGGEGLALRCDVRNKAECQAVVQQVIEKFGRVDILVNNAGVGIYKSVEQMSEEDWDANQDVNLKGTFLMCQAVVGPMKAQGQGRILNAASFAAIVPSYGSGAYASSKAGVHYFTRVLAGELGPWGITVNCYAPGMIPTELNHFAEAAPERQESLLNTLTLRRWGKAEEVAHLLCFLASDFAGYITGTMVDVSGGKLATQIPLLAYKQAETEGWTGGESL
jgi:3-oxoacyl-[acyl-carrier protein] reductase